MLAHARRDLIFCLLFYMKSTIFVDGYRWLKETIYLDFVARFFTSSMAPATFLSRRWQKNMQDPCCRGVSEVYQRSCNICRGRRLFLSVRVVLSLSFWFSMSVSRYILLPFLHKTIATFRYLQSDFYESVGKVCCIITAIKILYEKLL